VKEWQTATAEVRRGKKKEERRKKKEEDETTGQKYGRPIP